MFAFASQHNLSVTCARRVAGAVFLLLLSWVAQPVRLAAPEPVECTKTCCLDSGECCCLLAREADRDDEHAPPALKRLRPDCAQFSAATFSTKLPDFSLRIEPKPTLRLPEISLPQIGFTAPDILSFLLVCDKAPRAPPGAIFPA